MATVPQTDSAQEPEPGRGSRSGSGHGPHTARRRQAHWHAPLVGVAGRPWKRHKKHPAGAGGVDDTVEPPVRPPLPGTEPTGLRRLLKHFEPLSQIARAARFYPARLAVIVFAAIIMVVTLLLSLPIATASGKQADFLDALFTATSAACVTGLSTVDTATYWSAFGHVVIILAAAVGGLGVMTLASLLSLAVSRHVGLTQRMLAASENQSRLGEVGRLLRAVIYTATGCELLLTLMLLPRFLGHGLDVGRSLWYAAFMALSIFNNAGFVIMPEGLGAYATDWWIGLPIILGTFMGAVGFPVILDIMGRRRKPRTWSLHTKLTLTTYLALTGASTLAIATFEWNNPLTYGALPTGGKIMTALINGVNARSSGLSTIPPEHMHEATWFLQDALMFVGGGSASTAGGIKVSTFAVLLLAILAEARGDQDIEAFGRRITPSTVRLSVAVAFIGASVIGFATLLLLQMTNLSLDRILFEVISAFATVGLSTGITPTLPASAKYVIVALMFVGRVGTMTAASALALRERRRVIRMPEASPMIG